ncbi:MAG: hypothetical protein MESAZ_01576 [Saezia sanguinis]
MKKILTILFCVFVITGCSNDPYKIDSVATANAPWEKGEFIVNGFCSQAAIGWCVRVFLGITTDGKVLVQDFYTKIADRMELAKVYDPRTEEIEAKFTDPFTMMSIDDAQMNLFYVDDGKDGVYRSYDRDGEVDKEGAFRNGIKHGHWTEYLPNGEISSGNYVQGKKHGVWVCKSEDGSWYEETFEHGKLINFREFSK